MARKPHNYAHFQNLVNELKDQNKNNIVYFFLHKDDHICYFIEMKEPVDDDRDLSRDNLFKKLYRRTTDYWYEAKKPTPRSDIPWWKPSSFTVGWFSRDPITAPRPKYPLSWDYQFK